MISLDAELLGKEFEAACKVRDERLGAFRDQLKRFYGKSFRPDGAQDFPENAYFEYAALVVPKIIFNNPRVQVRSRRTDSIYRFVADAQRYAINRWIVDYNLREELQYLGLDAMFNWGAALCTADNGWPTITRLSQRHVAKDPLALKSNDYRYAFHRYVCDKEDLLREAEENASGDWDIEAVKALIEDQDLDEFYGEKTERPDRKQVVITDGWIRDASIEGVDNQEQFHGVIVKMACDGGSKYRHLRAPRPFYGPESGPYTFFDLYTVPDEPYALGPLTAINSQIEELNATAMANSAKARSYKNIIGVAAGANDLAAKLATSKDDYVVAIEGLLKENVVPMEIGGLSPQLIEHEAMLRIRADRNLGMSDAQRGVVTGDATATENAIASTSSDTRVGYMRQKFTDSTRQLLQRVGWYIYNDPDFRIDAGEEFAGMLAQMGLPPDPMFQGGVLQGIFGISYEDLQLDIEPYSMERTDMPTIQTRALQFFQLVTQAAPMIPTAPYVDWGTLFQLAGDAFNIPGAREIVNLELAQQMLQMPIAPSPQSGHVASETNSPPRQGYENQAQLKGGPNASVSVPGQSGGANRGLLLNGPGSSGGQAASPKRQGVPKGA